MEQRVQPVSDPSTALGRFLDRLLLRSTLGESAQQTIRHLPGRIVTLGREQDFAGPGAKHTSAHLVISGLAASWSEASDGQRQITAFHIPGDMPDLQSLVLPDMILGLQALVPTTVLRIPHEALRAAAADAEIAEAFWRDCAADAAIANEWVVNVGRRKARPRIAHLVCEVATRLGAVNGDNEFSFRLPVTQNQIGSATGLSTVHVNRSLQELKKDGLALLGGAEARVLDWKGLRDAAGFDPAYLHIGPSTHQ
jgi:CRP-like cAMP-binding protein